MTDNKRYWDLLKKTNPDFTKRINKGFGEITTIDPQWQIGKMTEVFGPVGIGWGYTVQYTYTEQLVFAEVSIWTEAYSNIYGPVCSVQKLWRKTGALDDEAPKKAMTDAMTKAFSHLGVSADVFLGMFDNSKYVEKVAAEYKSLNKSKVTEMKGTNDK
jgi:hypothetical protein|tara:strand:- start:92 stop:565 length:474 start_codon:yes stop_codon:yes gene_type:complete